MSDPQVSILKWTAFGTFIIILLGIILHYFYPWFGEPRWLGAFVPVNESVWEHLKLGFWGLVLFSIPEYFFIKRKVNNYFVSKFLGVLILELTILVIFYSYTYFTKKPILWVDISSFVLGVTFCQWLSYNLYLKKAFARFLQFLSLTGLVLIGFIFGYFTFHPPISGIFMDAIDFTYGIDKQTN
jgi:hypothetical protein